MCTTRTWNEIEVLEGPQGTLFGGGAEAGVIRYITNKPKINVTEGDVRSQLRHPRRQAATRPAAGSRRFNVPVIAGIRLPCAE